MIAWLGGRLMASDADGAVIDTGGVGLRRLLLVAHA